MDTGVPHHVGRSADGAAARLGAPWVMLAVKMFVAAVVVIVVAGIAAGVDIVLSLH